MTHAGGGEGVDRRVLGGGHLVLHEQVHVPGSAAVNVDVVAAVLMPPSLLCDSGQACGLKDPLLLHPLVVMVHAPLPAQVPAAAVEASLAAGAAQEDGVVLQVRQLAWVGTSAL
jgi:hypothetical protein